MKLFGTTTKLNLQLRDAADLPSALEAVREALFTGRKGPVHLNIPVDVLRASVPDDTWSNSGQPALIGASGLAESVRRGALHGAVDEIASALGIARSPLVLFGRGCHGSRELARRFADLSGVPAATTLQGKGVLCGEGDGRYFGVVGTGGSPRANAWVRGPCDLVLAVGTSLGEFTLDGFSPTGLSSKTVIRVDADSREFAKAPFVRANVEADAGEFLALLIDAWEVRCKRRAGASGGGRAPHGSADSREARDAREAAFDAFMAEVPVSVLLPTIVRREGLWRPWTSSQPLNGPSPPMRCSSPTPAMPRCGRPIT
jgi:acetolactate synthase-1/2/3 large subunit